MKRITSTSCRLVGPGGTTITFFSTKEGIKCIWENENCPYENISAVNHIPGGGEHLEAVDGHNVSMLSWDEIEKMLKSRPKDPGQIGMPQQRKK